MVINTVSNPIRLVDTGVLTFFGHPVPSNVTNMASDYDMLNGGKIIRWRVKGIYEVFSMDFPEATEENILAVLAAMRLSV